ncbi:MAG: hypothetical protein NZL83_00660 [Candidatus Absconditabacterales bacterium]|nr:hypothetical protein [Candidatus Absconditabacterales bacterium]
MVNVVRMVSKLLGGGVGTSTALLLFFLFYSGCADAARPATNNRHILSYRANISMYEGRQTMFRDDSTYVTLYTLLLPQSLDTFQLINILTFPYEGEEQEYWLLSASHTETINRLQYFLQELFKNPLSLLHYPDPCSPFLNTGIDACLCKNTQGHLFIILNFEEGPNVIDMMLLNFPNPRVVSCTVVSDK